MFETITGRRSIRAFKSDDVSQEMIMKLVEAAKWAPSAGNLQPWEFIVVRKSEVKKRLAEAAHDQAFIEEAPVVIVVCANEARSSESYGERGERLYCIQDTAAAIQNLLLAGYSLGLGTCWVGAFDEEKTKQILKIPCGIRLMAIIPVGYPAEFPQPRKLRPLEEIVHYEGF